MVRLLYIVLLVPALLTTSYGQVSNQIDSLKQLANQKLSKKQRVDVYNNICETLWHSNPQEAILYADSAYELVQEIDHPEGLVKALGNKGIAEYTNGRYDSAESFYLKAINKSIETKIPSEAKIYYLNLLKKRGDYNQIITVTRMMLPDNESLKNADPAYLRGVLDSFIELGNLTEASRYIEPVVSSTLYKKKGEFFANSNVSLSDYDILKGNYGKAEDRLRLSLKVYDSIQDIFGLARANLKLGDLKLSIGEIDSARLLLLKGLELYDSLDYNFGVAEAKRSIGSFYSIIANYGEASRYLFEALEIYEDQNNTNEMAKTYNELSWVYQSQAAFESAMDFINKSIQISGKVGNKSSQAMAYNIKGTILDQIDSLDEALIAYNRAYELSKEIGDKKSIAASMYNIGYLKEMMGEYDGVLESYIRSYKLERDIGNLLGMAISEYTLGNFYTKTGRYDSAEYYLDVSRERLRDLDSKDNLLYNYMYSGNLYETLGDDNQALVYYKRYIALKDSLVNRDISSKINELEVKYQLQNKDREIAFLNLENKSKQQELSLNEKTINNQRLIIGFSIFGAVLLAVLLFLSYRVLHIRNKTNKELKSLNEEIQEKNEEITAQAEELQEANYQISLMNESLEGKVGLRTQELKQAYKELDTFFYRSSHDFRGPLTTFLGLAEVARSTLKDEYSIDLFDKVETTALQLDKMVNKLKAISLIGAESLELSHINFEEFVDSMLEKWHRRIDEKNIKVEKEIDVTEHVISYKDLLEIIFDNLIENVINYCRDEHAFLKIVVKSGTSGVNIRIEDNGQGIDSSFHEKVFEMYFRSNEASEGNGLGLYLVKKAVDRLRGTINLKSRMNEGTTINVFLPELGQ